jgi:hypothetical protein
MDGGKRKARGKALMLQTAWHMPKPMQMQACASFMLCWQCGAYNTRNLSVSKEVEILGVLYTNRIAGW